MLIKSFSLSPVLWENRDFKGQEQWWDSGTRPGCSPWAAPLSCHPKSCSCPRAWSDFLGSISHFSVFAAHFFSGDHTRGSSSSPSPTPALLGSPQKSQFLKIPWIWQQKGQSFPLTVLGFKFSSSSDSWEENLLPIFSFLNIFSPRFRHWIIWTKPIQCCLGLCFIHHRRVEANGTRNIRIPFSGDKEELWGALTELPWRNKYFKSMWNCCIPAVSLHYFVNVISSPLDLKNSKVNYESVSITLWLIKKTNSSI